ncbi:hypothetical protein F5882DRAFT_518171 [Hyaloscypha sp. PMI_1271]|nr:hypothetical protein F5882DRAFT_518171 [Hyaloscypha sp. PMI_1271]
MPYMTVIIPQVTNEHKDAFLGSWGTISKEMKDLPFVLGVSGGEIVAQDGALVTDFKFLQTMAFATLEDAKALKTSEWAQAQKGKYEATAAGPPLVGMFKVADFPKGAAPKAFTQFSRITISDESKHEEVRKAWEELMGILGKESWGGVSVGEGEHVGLGLVGWDSLEEAGAAMKEPKVAAAWTKYHSLGSCKDVMVKLE